MIVAPQLQLPSAPTHLTGAVKAWSEPVSIPSALGEALHDRVWDAVHIENEFFRLLILPELNGCIFLALDKTTDTDLFQRSSVIGSELVGLNFVWPRAAITDILLTADTKIEGHLDGSQTVWCSRYDPLTRMKGMHGICLQPGRSYIQVKVRLYNRTPLTQTYAWQPEAALANKDKLRIVHIAGERTVDAAGYAYLAPYETRSLNEYWYAIATPDNGEPMESNADVTVTLVVDREIVRAGVYVTRAFNSLNIRLMQGKTVLAQWSRDLSPLTPFAEHVVLPEITDEEELSIVVLAAKNRELIRFDSRRTRQPDAVPLRPEVRLPRQIKTVQELYFTGLYLNAHSPEASLPQDYWQEALRRDPHDVRCNNALGNWYLRKGEFLAAERHFRNATVALTSLNPNPPDTEPLYHLGLTLRHLGRDDEAYEWLTKACSCFAWQSPAYLALAEIDVAQSRPEIALDHLRQAIRVNTENLNARNLTGAILRRFGASAETNRIITENLTLDSLDGWSQFAAGQPVTGGNQVRLDIAFDLARAGLIEEAIAVLKGSDRDSSDGSVPMVQYALGDSHGRAGRYFEAHQHHAAATQTSTDNCSPSRLDELQILQRATQLNEQDARAPYLLGIFFDAHGLHEEAIENWEISARRDPTFAAVWRKLGKAQLRVFKDPYRARRAYDRAWELDQSDAQTFYERDQLWKVSKASALERLAEFEASKELVNSRADLVLELAALYNRTDRYEDALALLQTRGESEYYAESRIQTLLLLGQRRLGDGFSRQAQAHFTAAFDMAKTSGLERNEILYWLGEPESSLGHTKAAVERWSEAANLSQTHTYYSALALDRLGYRLKSRSVLRKIVDRSRELRAQGDEITANFLEAQARVGLGQLDRARRLLETVLSLDPGHLKAESVLRFISSPTRYL